MKTTMNIILSISLKNVIEFKYVCQGIITIFTYFYIFISYTINYYLYKLFLPIKIFKITNNVLLGFLVKAHFLHIGYKIINRNF
jgi:hypothetical protein